MIDESEEALDPPGPQRVALRALVLAAVSCRGLIEEDSPNPRAESLRKKVREWLEQIGAIEEVEAREGRLLATRLGELSSVEELDASWVSEGAAVLAWALERAELPSFHEPFRPADVARCLGFLEPRDATAAFEPSLREPEEIEWLANHYLTVHWRLRQFGLDGEPMDFRAMIDQCSWGPLTADGLSFLEADLAIGSLPIAKQDPDVLHAVRSIVQERHQALNWLLGEEALYSEVTTDT